VRVLNAVILASFITNTVLTFLSITGAYGHTNAELSAKYQSLATPAGWAFAVWSVIFTSETVYAVAQCLPALRDADEVKRAGPWFSAACLFQGAWSVAFGHELICLSQALILGILLSLWRANAALQAVTRASESPPSWGRYALLHLPLTIHFGWLTAASAVSINLTLVFAMPKAHVALLTTAIATLTAVLLPALSNPATTSSGGSDAGYALTVAWALAGVASQNRAPLDDAPLADPIKGWCPELVTDSLAAVAATLSAVIVASVLVRALSLLVYGRRKASSATAAVALLQPDVLTVKP